MSHWKEIERNADHKLWSAPLSGGGAILVAGGLSDPAPPDWMVDHHFKLFGNNPPKVELGARGHRYLFPGETEWREYGYVPRAP